MTEAGDDLRQMLGGIWFAVGVFAAVIVLLVDILTPVLGVPAVKCALVAVVSIPSAFGCWHLAFPGAFPAVGERIDELPVVVSDLVWLMDLLVVGLVLFLSFA